ncbi:MAG: response regulator [Lentisphaerae bacterium]|nr:response regulator [Lentisphaerota bacterium]
MTPRRILIVDDKPENLYLLRAMLEGAGYTVDAAAHGGEALEAARRNRPDLVVADVLMPVMDGFTLCRQWRKDEEFRSIPFVFYTATYTDERDREFALSLGANDFIVKPQEPDELTARLREIMEAGARPDPADASTSKPPSAEEQVFLQQYNETLVRKLEAKTEELEKDIAARKKIESDLRASEERFRSFVENANDIVYSLSPDGVFTYVSPNWTEWLGHAPAEVQGHPMAGFVHPDDVTICLGAMDQARSGAKVAGIEYRVRHKDGSWRWHMSNGVFARIASGEAPSFLGIARDITSIKQAEQEQERLQAQMNQMQKMESVGRLAGGVAHDFNNMLQAILGHVELAMEQIRPDHPVHENLQEIRKAASRSADLTRQLLAFARKQTIAPRVLDLNQTVDGLIKLLRRLIGEDVRLEWRPGPNLGTVKIDPSQIDQILANLCVNARDALGDSGRIVIETASASFDAAHCTRHEGHLPGEYAVLSVADNGSGMPPEVLANIFEPFFTTKEVGKGTGLGLPTVYGIVKQNGGFIDVASQTGQGTTFRIYLPLYRDPAAGAPPAPEPPPSGGKETILLVEDEPSILTIGTIMLKKLGYTVHGAATPEKALEIARLHPNGIQLLIADVVIPEMNGRDLSRRLLEICPDLRVLFMSGYTADVIAHHGVLDHGVHFLEKPFTMTSLAAKVREALEH